MKRGAHAPLFFYSINRKVSMIPLGLGAKKSLVFHWVLGSNYATNNTTTRVCRQAD
jgi:hypothetical protein